MWRDWRALPPKGKIGILVGAWHTAPIVKRVLGGIGKAEVDQAVAEIVRFERMLPEEGVLILKFWFHLTKAQQKTRLTALEKDPATRWRVTRADRKRAYAEIDDFELQLVQSNIVLVKFWLAITKNRGRS